MRVALIQDGEVHNIVIATSLAVALLLWPTWTTADATGLSIAQNLPGAHVDARSTDMMTAASGQWTLEVVGTATNTVDLVQYAGATRFDRVVNGRSCLYYRLDSTDPDTASAKRIECSSSGPFRLIQRNERFRVSVSTSFDATGTTDDQILFQLHTVGASPQNPVLALVARGGSGTWVLRANADADPQQAGNTVVELWAGPISAGWIDWALDCTMNPAAGGQCVIHANGQQIVSYTGPFGYTGRGAYVKAGIYHWLNDNAWDVGRPSRECWQVGPRVDVLGV